MFVKLSDGYLKNANYNMDIDANINVMQQKILIKLKAVYTITGR